MTISSTIRKAGPFTGNGVAVAFPFAFKVFAAADLLVLLAVTSTGVETTLVLASDYTVTLNADQNTSPGGSVTLLVAPPVGYTVALASQVGNLQPLELTNAGGFYPRILNDAFDRVTIQVQQLAEQLSRTFKVSLSSGSTASTSIYDYLTAAASSATSALSSAASSSGSAASSAASSSAASASATAAAVSALAAVTPTASAVALYLDAFPLASLVTFSSLYLAGGWDLGSIAPASPFPNENVLRRAMLSAGGGSFNFGTVPY